MTRYGDTTEITFAVYDNSGEELWSKDVLARRWVDERSLSTGLDFPAINVPYEVAQEVTEVRVTNDGFCWRKPVQGPVSDLSLIPNRSGHRDLWEMC